MSCFIKFRIIWYIALWYHRQKLQALASRNAAIMVRDADAPNELVECMLRTVTNDGVLKTLAENVAAMAQRNSAARIVDEVMKIINC